MLTLTHNYITKLSHDTFMVWFDVVTSLIIIFMVYFYFTKEGLSGGDYLEWANSGMRSRVADANIKSDVSGDAGQLVAGGPAAIVDARYGAQNGFLGHMEQPVIYEAGDIGTFRGLSAGDWSDSAYGSTGLNVGLGSDLTMAKSRAAAGAAQMAAVVAKEGARGRKSFI